MLLMTGGNYKSIINRRVSMYGTVEPAFAKEEKTDADIRANKPPEPVKVNKPKAMAKEDIAFYKLVRDGIKNEPDEHQINPKIRHEFFSGGETTGTDSGGEGGGMMEQEPVDNLVNSEEGD